ncbi:hypothetical protein [Actinomyces ruminis]|uniref:hypothetical protein n=1 Tax=Actinomyces ruminis TaxID=1937003 RepID=UPI001C556DFC|nr:hypothetical protein [Actinomyces ruminis]
MINQIENPFENDDDSVMPLKSNDTIHDTYNTILEQSDAGLSAGLSQWSEDWVNAFQNDASPPCSARRGCSVWLRATPQALRAGTWPRSSPAAAATGAAPT